MFQPYVWKDATHRVYIFLFKILLQKYWFESFSCFWSNLLSLAGFFLLNVLSKKSWIEVFSSFWSSFFAGCLFLEVPSFSGQYERKAQNLEWGPSDLTLATFAVLTCWTTRTWNAATPPSKGAICRVCIFLFKFSSQKYWFGSFSYLFILLVESPFACGFFPFKRFIERVLVWSVCNLLVFLFAGCLFLEVPSFSGQFERKAQNLEWGPSDSTHGTFAVFTC